jgi:restriction system protein
MRYHHHASQFSLNLFNDYFSKPLRYNKSMAKRYRQKKATNEAVILLLGLAVIGIGGSGAGFSSTSLIALLLIGLIIGAAVLAYAFYLDFRRQRALRLLDMAAVDTMSGLAFEKWVGAQLRARGYKVRLTPVNDYGVDIVAKKDGLKTAVQVKRYRKALDQKPVREAVAGMMHYKCALSMVVTNSYFTKAAKVLATSNRCELIDRDKLAGWLTESKPAPPTV